MAGMAGTIAGGMSITEVTTAAVLRLAAAMLIGVRAERRRPCKEAGRDKATCIAGEAPRPVAPRAAAVVAAGNGAAPIARIDSPS